MWITGFLIPLIFIIVGIFVVLWIYRKIPKEEMYDFAHLTEEELGEEVKRAEQLLEDYRNQRSAVKKKATTAIVQAEAIIAYAKKIAEEDDTENNPV